MITNKDQAGIQKLLNDHHVLMEYICGVREWISDVAEWGRPRFGELGTRLATFRETLARHFADEESQECELMEEHRSRPVSESSHDWRHNHHDFLTQLDTIIERLKAMDPEFTTWQEAGRQVESLITEICEHEEQEIQFLQSSLENA